MRAARFTNTNIIFDQQRSVLSLLALLSAFCRPTRHAARHTGQLQLHGSALADLAIDQQFYGRIALQNHALWRALLPLPAPFVAKKASKATAHLRWHAHPRVTHTQHYIFAGQEVWESSGTIGIRTCEFSAAMDSAAIRHCIAGFDYNIKQWQFSICPGSVTLVARNNSHL